MCRLSYFGIALPGIVANQLIRYSKKHPRLEIIFFPTASPDLNPQEHVWKAVRKKVSHNHLEARLPELADRFLNKLNSGIFKDIFLARYGYTCYLSDV